MKRTLTFAFTVLTLAAPAAAAPGSVPGFQLPAPPAPTNTPEVQGPIDSERPIATRPRAIAAPEPGPAPTPSPTASTLPAPRENAPPRPIVQPRPDSARAAATRNGAGQVPVPRNAPEQSAPRTAASANPSLVPAAPDGAAPVQDAAGTPADNPLGTALPPAAPGLEASTSVTPTPAGSSPFGAIQAAPVYLWWIAGATLLVLLLVGAAVIWRRRAPATGSAPLIDPPLVRTPSQPATATTGATEAPVDPVVPATAAAPFLPIQIRAEALSLSRSLMNTALTYRFDLMNIGAADLTDISVRAEMITAHNQAPTDDQVAHEASQLPFISLFPHIPKGDQQELKGDLRLPVSSIRWIAQGPAKLYVPLVRLRIEAEGFTPAIHTFVVGVRPDTKGGKLLPFRLDEMAQTYRNIGFRTLS